MRSKDVGHKKKVTPFSNFNKPTSYFKTPLTGEDGQLQSVA